MIEPFGKAHPERVAMVFGNAHAIAGRRARTQAERVPERFKIWNSVTISIGAITASGRPASEHVSRRASGVQKGNRAPSVEPARVWIEGGRSLPESVDETDASARMVPDMERQNTPGFQNTLHFDQTRTTVWHKVQDEGRCHDVDAVILRRQGLGCGRLETHPGAGDGLARVGDEVLGRVGCEDRIGRMPLQDGRGQGAGSANDLQPIGRVFRGKPVEEFPCDQPTPSAPVVLVALPRAPGIEIRVCWHCRDPSK
nr:hypothetical protein [Roseisalinus antarcticus]